MPQIRGWAGRRGVGRVEREGRWVNDALRHSDQVVCTVGQTDGHSSPDHEWNSLGLQATLLMYPSGPTWSELVLHSLTGSAKSRL